VKSNPTLYKKSEQKPRIKNIFEELVKTRARITELEEKIQLAQYQITVYPLSKKKK